MRSNENAKKADEPRWPLHASILAGAKRVGLSVRELALLTMEDFDVLCCAWVGEKGETRRGVRQATQEDLKKLFPR